MHKPAVVTFPESVERLKKGFDQLAELTALTYGPARGVVVYKDALKSQPEVLVDAASMLRRVTSLGDSSMDVGAMIMRNPVWRVRERVGDGGATTAVLAQAIFDQAVRVCTAGAHAVEVQQGIRIGAEQALRSLQSLRAPVQQEGDLEAIARSVTGDDDLAFMLGEIFGILGATGHVAIEEFVAPYLDREYVDGGRWRAALVSHYLINSPGMHSTGLDDCQVALYEGTLSEIEDVAPLLELAIQHDPPHLLLVAQKISEDALNLIVTTHLKSKLKIAAVALERVGEKGLGDLEDLALITGARLFSAKFDRGFRSIQSENLGGARRAEADSQYLQLSGGAGDPIELQKRIEHFQRLIEVPNVDDGMLEETQMRLGRLAGSMAVLKIGAHTAGERSGLKIKAEQGIKAIQAALQDGVLPGGGCAYLHCIPELKKLTRVRSGLTQDQAAGVRALAIGLEAPFRRLLANAQISTPGLILAQIQHSAPDIVYDVINKKLSAAQAVGILDAYPVLAVALETAVSGAAMAIGTEVLILKRKPRMSYEP